MLHAYLDLIAAGPQTLSGCIDYIERRTRQTAHGQPPRRRHHNQQ